MKFPRVGVEGGVGKPVSIENSVKCSIPTLDRVWKQGWGWYMEAETKPIML